MNIFYLHHDPKQAAEWMVDKHVVKMILESAQLLSTAHRVLDGRMVIYDKYVDGSLPPRYRKSKKWELDDFRDNVLYKATHVNHPSAVWVRQSLENYQWLVDHFYALMDEYEYRYGKKHKCWGFAHVLYSPPYNLRDYDWTPMPSAMADQYKVGDDPIMNYRNYYKVAKERMHKWTKREAPEWIAA
jgi:hypothetical protein